MAVMGGEIEFKAYTPSQGQLLPSYTADALDPADPAFFVDEVVEGLDLRAFERRYSALGERAYPPRMLLKLWLCGPVRGSEGWLRGSGAANPRSRTKWPLNQPTRDQLCERRACRRIRRA
jgi:hypothetical protein